MVKHDLRCNELQCRRQLTMSSQAVVTTCSHIFCVECAETLFTEARLCPACGTQLAESADDIVYTSLNPSPAYKTTILAGLDPTIINDICGRALGFWTYQITQEATFQNLVLKDAQERASKMEQRINTLVREANAELEALKSKITELYGDLQHITRKNRELTDTNTANAKGYTKLKHQYEKMVGRSMSANATKVVGMNLGKSGYAPVGNGNEIEGSVAPGQIGATPSRAFHPVPFAPSAQQQQQQQHASNSRRSSNHMQMQESSRLVPFVNNADIPQAGNPQLLLQRGARSHASSGTGTSRSGEGGGRNVQHQQPTTGYMAAFGTQYVGKNSAAGQQGSGGGYAGFRPNVGARRISTSGQSGQKMMYAQDGR